MIYNLIKNRMKNNIRFEPFVKNYIHAQRDRKNTHQNVNSFFLDVRILDYL